MADKQEELDMPSSSNGRRHAPKQGHILSNDIAQEHRGLAPPRLPDADDLGLPIDASEDQEEPTLPAHPISFDRDGAPFLAISKRKRSAVSQLMSDSSEMPIFSSDDDPAAENYHDGHGRQKRQYTGSWDRQQPIQNSSPRAESRVKRKLERQVDSGVFMGSDASADSSLDGFPTRPPAWNLPGPQFTQIPRSSRQSDLSQAEAKARSRIQQCLDTDNETVDLSNLNMETISNTTVAKLAAISPAPYVRQGVPFSNQDPQLKLFLFRNSLSRLPKELFHLDHLTVLSLRANRLTEIPPIILRMTNLKELNLSQNSLKHLPMELLELMYSPNCRLEALHLFPNPFCQPEAMRPCPEIHGMTRHPSDFFEAPQRFDSRWLSMTHDFAGFRAKHWARTPVQFSSTRGDIFSTFRLDSDMYLATEDVTSEPVFPTPAGPRNKKFHPTKVFSLTELMLQSCLRSTDLTPDYWRNSYICDPTSAKDYGHIIEPLEDMQRQREAGSLRCTVCQRNVIRPTAQWIEWWELWCSRFDENQVTLSSTLPGGITRYPGIGFAMPLVSRDMAIEVREIEPLTSNSDERLVPFLRRACSWGCVKDPVRGLGNMAPTQRQHEDSPAQCSHGIAD